jgi:hypothetical protein
MAFTNAHYIWTNHLRDRLKERRIPESYLTQTLNNPDKTFHNDGKTELQKRFEQRTVTAVAKENERGEKIVVSCWINPPFPGTTDAKKKSRYWEIQKASPWKKFWLTVLNQLGL